MNNWTTSEIVTCGLLFLFLWPIGIIYLLVKINNKGKADEESAKKVELSKEI